MASVFAVQEGVGVAAARHLLIGKAAIFCAGKLDIGGEGRGRADRPVSTLSVAVSPIVLAQPRAMRDVSFFIAGPSANFHI